MDAMTSIRRLQASLLLAAGLLAFALPVAADSVQLSNGDTLHGRVVSLNDKQLHLQSDTLGQLDVPRAKVVAITFGEKKSAPTVNLRKDGTINNTPEAILKQLKTSGVQAKDVSDIQKMFPLLATPEASSYFNDTVKGLLGGSLNVGDIRKDAIRARDELKKAVKGLGPDVEGGVAPYLMILDKFIRETEPPAPVRPETRKSEKNKSPK